MLGRSVLGKICHKQVPRRITCSIRSGLNTFGRVSPLGGQSPGVEDPHWATACGRALSNCDLRPQQSGATWLPQVADISNTLRQLLQRFDPVHTLRNWRFYQLQHIKQVQQQLQQVMEVDAELLVPQQLQVHSQQEPAGRQQQQQPLQQGLYNQQQQQPIPRSSQPEIGAQVNGASAGPALVQQVVDVTTGSSSAAAVLLSSSDTQQPPLGNSSSKEGQNDSQTQQHQQAQQQEAGEAQQGNKQQQKPQKRRPTHFVSLRVSQSPQVIECFERVQQQLVSVEPKLQPCLLEPITAHMTVLVLHVQTEEQETLATSVLSSLPEVLQQQGLGQLQVTLQGLSTFRNQVLYLDVGPGPALNQLQQLGDAVISHFRDQGSEIFVDEGGRGFTPHVTVAKTSRLKGFHHRHKRGRGNTKIPHEAWSDLTDVSAGDVLLTELQICSMQGRRTGEFYKVTHSIQLPEVPPQPPPKAAGEPAAPAAAEPPVRQRKRAAGSPLAGAKQRFKRLLDALVCRKREELGHVDTDSKH